MWRILSSHWTPSRDFFHKSISKRTLSNHVQANCWPAFSNCFQHLQIVSSIFDCFGQSHSPAILPSPKLRLKATYFAAQTWFVPKFLVISSTPPWPTMLGQRYLEWKPPQGGNSAHFFGRVTQPPEYHRPTELFVLAAPAAIALEQMQSYFYLERFQSYFYWRKCKPDLLERF